MSWSASVIIKLEQKTYKAALILQEKKGNFHKSWKKLTNKIEKKCGSDLKSSRISSFEFYFVEKNGLHVLINDETDLKSK